MPYPETVKYIKKQLDKGITAERVKKALLDSGYKKDVIDQLMEKAGVTKEKKKTEGIEKLLLKEVAIGVFILIVAGSLVYFGFFVDKGAPIKEFFSPPPAEEGIKIDFSKISPLSLEKNKQTTIDLSKYVKDSRFDSNLMEWSYSGKICVNIKISGTKALLKSIYLPGCPMEEDITFEATNPYQDSASRSIKVQII